MNWTVECGAGETLTHLRPALVPRGQGWLMVSKAAAIRSSHTPRDKTRCRWGPQQWQSLDVHGEHNHAKHTCAQVPEQCMQGNGDVSTLLRPQTAHTHTPTPVRVQSQRPSHATLRTPRSTLQQFCTSPHTATVHPLTHTAPPVPWQGHWCAAGSPIPPTLPPVARPRKT